MAGSLSAPAANTCVWPASKIPPSQVTNNSNKKNVRTHMRLAVTCRLQIPAAGLLRVCHSDLCCNGVCRFVNANMSAAVTAHQWLVRQQGSLRGLGVPPAAGGLPCMMSITAHQWLGKQHFVCSVLGPAWQHVITTAIARRQFSCNRRQRAWQSNSKPTSVLHCWHNLRALDV
jgi:hypothetical protein